MPHPVHPLVLGLLRVGARAGLAALDSALQDAEKTMEEGLNRVKRARKRTQKIAQIEEEEEE